MVPVSLSFFFFKYDLGGPGVIGIELHGVVSFGPTRYDTHATPTVFTKVFKYARWLDKLFHKVYDGSNVNLL